MPLTEGFFLWYGILSLLASGAYAALIFYYIKGWRSLSSWEVPKDFDPGTRISVVIAARNEAANITPCLESIARQHYPPHLWEIIVVDDYSEDETAAVVRALPYKNISLFQLSDSDPAPAHHSFKKKALEAGIRRASGELIVTTDADCAVQEDWLLLISSLYEKKAAALIAGPVGFYQENNPIERFQSLDFLGMMGVTAAGIHTRQMRMCNGANLAYPKKIFEQAGGFDGINDLASGDDIFLAQKIARLYPDGIFFLKNPQATVFTTAKPDWRSFFSQRLRWASKSTHYIEWKISLALGIVFMNCGNILISLLLAFFLPAIFILFLFQLMIKACSDYYFLRMMSRYFGRTELLRSFIPSFFLHTWYILSVGMMSNFIKKYEWKGRRVS